MGEITYLFQEETSEKDRLIQILNDIIDMAENEEIEGIMISGKRTDGDLITGYANLSEYERLTLMEYQKINISNNMMIRFIEDNYVTPEK